MRWAALALALIAFVPCARAADPPPPHARVYVLPPHTPADRQVRADLIAFVRTQHGWLTPPFDAAAPGVAALPEYEIDIRVVGTQVSSTDVTAMVTLCVERRAPGGTVCVTDRASAPLGTSGAGTSNPTPIATATALAADAAAQLTWSAAQDFINAR